MGCPFGCRILTLSLASSSLASLALGAAPSCTSGFWKPSFLRPALPSATIVPSERISLCFVDVLSSVVRPHRSDHQWAQRHAEEDRLHSRSRNGLQSSCQPARYGRSHAQRWQISMSYVLRSHSVDMTCLSRSSFRGVSFREGLLGSRRKLAMSSIKLAMNLLCKACSLWGVNSNGKACGSAFQCPLYPTLPCAPVTEVAFAAHTLS
jgi:hypothetical protein